MGSKSVIISTIIIIVMVGHWHWHYTFKPQKHLCNICNIICWMLNDLSLFYQMLKIKMYFRSFFVANISKVKLIIILNPKSKYKCRQLVKVRGDPGLWLKVWASGGPTGQRTISGRQTPAVRASGQSSPPPLVQLTPDLAFIGPELHYTAVNEEPARASKDKTSHCLLLTSSLWQ